VALVVLGGCGVQGVPEETAAQTTEALVTTQAIVPQISPEEAQQIISDIVDEKNYTAWDDVIHIITDEQPGSGFHPVDGYYEVRITHFNGYKSGIAAWFYVDCITGEPFETSFFGEGEWRPLKNLRYLKKTDEEWEAANAAAKMLFPDNDVWLYDPGYCFAQRDDREYSIYYKYWVETKTHDYYFCDLATNELFYWDLDTDTLTPYSPA